MIFRYLYALLFVLNFFMSNLYGTDSLIKTKQIKLDALSVYYSLFDVREQYRLGIEYEKAFIQKWKINYHLDLGIFDQYQYNKYYHFFPNNTNGYREQTNVTTFGFHFLYSLNYRLNRTHKKVALFTGVVSDFNFFNKKSVKYSSLDNNKEKSKYQQYRIGIGPEIGLSFKLYNKFNLELKSAMLLKLLTIKTKENTPMIKPHKSLWFDIYHSYWLIPRINLCYEI